MSCFPKQAVSVCSLQKLFIKKLYSKNKFVLGPNVAWKQFSKKLLITSFGFKQFFNASHYILRKWFQLCHSKICKKLKNTLFNPFQSLSTFRFYLRVASKPFSEMFTMINFGFKDLLTFCLALTLSGFNFFTQN